MSLETLFPAPLQLAMHAPILVIIAPLVGACLVLLAPSPRWAAWAQVAATLFAGWMALTLAAEISRAGVATYAVGGFAAPMGIALRADALGAVFAMVIAAGGLACAAFAASASGGEIDASRRAPAGAALLLAQAGVTGMVLTGDAFNAFVFLEVASIPAYALVAIGEGRGRAALPAAFAYLVAGAIGATFYLLGVGFLYGATGALDMNDLSQRLPTLMSRPDVQAGFALIMTGLALKAAVFPMHAWLPSAYAAAPSAAAAFLSAASSKAAIVLLARFLFTVFPHGALVELFLHWLLAPAAVAGAIVCGVQAAATSDLRRMFALSSVAQTGLALTGLALATPAGASAAIFNLAADGLAKTALFLALAALALGAKTRSVDDLAGLAREAPWTAAVLAVGAASLLGAPLTVGFIGKWRLLEAAFSAGAIWAVIAIAAGSLLTLAYCGRLVEAACFRRPDPGAARLREPPTAALAPALVLTALLVWFGLDAATPLHLAEQAAARLLGAAP